MRNCILQFYANMISYPYLNTLRRLQYGHHFPDDIFKCICLNENVWISLNIILKFVPKVQLNNIPALVQIMAWHRPGDKPLSEPKMESLLMHICFTRPQWVELLAGLADLCWWQNFYYSEVLSSCPNHGCIETATTSLGPEPYLPDWLLLAPIDLVW